MSRRPQARKPFTYEIQIPQKITLIFSSLFYLGVLLHTDAPDGKIPYIYLDVKEVPHDSNLTMNLILKTLLENKHRLGRTLFLQLDNCYRENKNKFLLSLSSLLVEENVFEEVSIVYEFIMQPLDFNNRTPYGVGLGINK